MKTPPRLPVVLITREGGHRAGNAGAGFTLIELMIVIGIIAVLTAVALPIYSSVTERSKGAKCLSNLRQIAVGIQGYAADHNQTYPLGWTNSAAEDPDGRNVNSWVERTIPYLGQNTMGDRTVWVCPSAPLPIKRDTASWAYSYALHGRLGPPYKAPGDPSYVAPMRASLVDRPSSVIMVADATQNPSNKNLPDTNLWRPAMLYNDLSQTHVNDVLSATDTEGVGSLSFQHSGQTCNVVMADGSARVLKRGEVRKGDFAVRLSN